MTRTWADLVAALADGNVPTLSGRPVRFSLVSYASPLPDRYCIHEGDLPLLAQAAGIVQAAPAGWLSRDRFAEAIGCYPLHPGFKRLWDTLKEAAEKEGAVHDETGRAILMRPYRLHARVALCIHISEGPWFERRAGIAERMKLQDHPRWSPGWLARDDVGRAIDATPTTVFFKELWEQVRTIAQGEGTGTVRDRPVKAMMLAHTTKVTAYLHEESVASFAAAHAEVKGERNELFKEPRRKILDAGRELRSARVAKARLLRGNRDPSFAVTRTQFAERVDELRRQPGQAPRVAGGHDVVRRAVVRRWNSLADTVSRSGLWDHQKEAVRKFADHFGKPDTDPQGICVIPPGGGKTEIFANLVNAAMTDGGEGTPNVVVLVPTKQMIEQTLTRLGSGFPLLSPGALSSFHGGDVRPVTVMTYAGFAWCVDEGALAPEDVDLLVLDECHRALSDIRQDVFGRFVGNTLIAAFSATPAFDTAKNVYVLLGTANALVDVAMGRLIADGILAPVSNYIVCVSLKGRMPRGREATADVIRRATASAALSLHEHHSDGTRGLPLSGRRFIAFTKDRAHNAVAVQTFAGAGRRVRELSGQDSLARQVGTLAALQRGEIDGVFNARLLVEGTDLPKVSVVLNVAHTDSLVVEIQRSGRALRLDPDLAPDDPAQTAMIFDFYVEHEGIILGKPRFFFETVGGEIPVRLVTGPTYDVSRIPVPRPGKRGPAPVASTETPAPSSVTVDQPYMTVRAEMRSVHYLLARRDGTDEFKTEEWLPRTYVMAALKMTYKNPRFEAGWAMLVSARSGNVSVVDGHAYGFAPRNVVTGTMLCLHRDGIEAFAKLVGADLTAVAASESRIGKIDVSKCLGTSHKDSKFAVLWEEIVEAHRKGPPYLVRGEALDLRMVRGRVWTYLTVSEDDLPWIRAQCGLGLAAPMSDGWLGWTEIKDKVAANKSQSRIGEAWGFIKEAAEAGKDTVVLNGEIIEIGRVERKGRVISVVRASSAKALLSALGPSLPVVPRKSVEWLAKGEVAKALRINPTSKLMNVIYGELLPPSLTEGSVWLGEDEVRVSLRRNRSKWLRCVHRDDVDAIRRRLRIPGDAGTDWVPRTRASRILWTTDQHPGFAQAWDGLVALVEAGRRPELEGRAVRFEVRTTRPKATLHMHVDDLPVLAEAAGLSMFGADRGLKPWEEGWMPRNKTASALSVDPENGDFLALWDELCAVAGTAGRVRGLSVRVERMRNRARHAVYVHESAIPGLRRILSALRQGQAQAGPPQEARAVGV